MKLFQMAISIANQVDRDYRSKRLRDLHDASHPTCRYYGFLYQVADRCGPLDVVEIGTYVGTSAAHLASSNYRAVGDDEFRGQITTIDINPDAKRQVDALGFPNIIAMTGDSLSEGILGALAGRKFDILYVDGLHNFSQAYREYFYYRHMVREGGLMIFDDVGLEMDGDEMNVLWDAIPEPKQRLDHLHPNTGFGIVEKTTMEILDPDRAMKLAYPIIKSRQKHP